MKKYMLVILLLFVFGCVKIIDVTDDVSFNYGYKKGKIYHNKIDLYLIDNSNANLAIPGELSPSIGKYLNNKHNFPDIRGIVNKNQKIVVEKIIYRKAFESTYIDVFAKIMSGEYKGDLVRLNWISRHEFKPYPQGGYVPTPDPEILDMIE